TVPSPFPLPKGEGSECTLETPNGKVQGNVLHVDHNPSCSVHRNSAFCPGTNRSRRQERGSSRPVYGHAARRFDEVDRAVSRSLSVRRGDFLSGGQRAFAQS